MPMSEWQEAGISQNKSEYGTLKLFSYFNQHDKSVGSCPLSKNPIFSKCYNWSDPLARGYLQLV